MAVLRFFVPGRPIPKQSFRAGPRPWQPKRVTDYAYRVRCVATAAAHRAGWLIPGLETPVSVVLRFGFARPKSARKSERELTSLRVTVPDVDNASKGVLDAMNVLWSDDRQVCALRCLKLTVPRSEEGVYITVETLENEELKSEIISSYDPG